MQPVGGAKKESRLFGMVEDRSRLRVHVQSSLADIDFQLCVGRHVVLDIFNLLVIAKLAQYEHGRQMFIFRNLALDLMTALDSGKVGIPIGEVVYRNAGDRIDEGQPDGEITNIAVEAP